MHVSLDSALGRQRRLNSVGESVLQIAPSAAAAYSLRSLTGGDPEVVNVRRSSDNVEEKFTASGISSGALLDFVKTEAVTYTSDFSTDTDGWSVNNGALAVSGGALEMTPNSVSITHHTSKSGQVAAGTKARISFDVKIPSGQSLVTGFKLVEISGTTIKNVANQTQGDFVSYSKEFTSTNAGILRFFANKDGNVTFAGDDSEKLIIKNIVVTSIDENGFVQTWFDQSGNSKDAVQLTDDNQPKIVNDGALVLDSGIAGLDFDGSTSSRFLVAPSVSDLEGSLSMFSTSVRDATGYTVSLSNSSSGVKYFGIQEGGSSSVANPRNTTDVLVSDSVSGVDRLTFALTTGATSTSVGTNGSAVTTSTSDYGDDFDEGDLNQIAIGLLKTVSASDHFNGRIREILVYTSDQTDNRTALETNIAAEYGITLS